MYTYSSFGFCFLFFVFVYIPSSYLSCHCFFPLYTSFSFYFTSSTISLHSLSTLHFFHLVLIIFFFPNTYIIFHYTPIQFVSSSTSLVFSTAHIIILSVIISFFPYWIRFSVSHHYMFLLLLFSLCLYIATFTPYVIYLLLVSGVFTLHFCLSLSIMCLTRSLLCV